MLFAECGPFCALQECCEGVQVEFVMPEFDIFVSSTSTITLDHNKLKNNTFVENNGHFDNEFDFAGTKGLDIKPQRIVSSFPFFTGHHASRFAAGAFQGGFSHFSPISKKCGVPPAVRRSPGRWKFPRCVLIKWLCRVSVGQKIHAVSSSDSSRPASHNTASHDQNFVTLPRSRAS